MNAKEAWFRQFVYRASLVFSTAFFSRYYWLERCFLMLSGVVLAFVRCLNTLEKTIATRGTEVTFGELQLTAAILEIQ